MGCRRVNLKLRQPDEAVDRAQSPILTDDRHEFSSSAEPRVCGRRKNRSLACGNHPNDIHLAG
jgi:hypothetical protein